MVNRMQKIKITIHLETEDEIIGIKEDFATYCEKFGDVTMVDVEKESHIMTNFDRIKAMSIDEMARRLSSFNCNECTICAFLSKSSCWEEDCIGGHKEWLESEVEPDAD